VQGGPGGRLLLGAGSALRSGGLFLGSGSATGRPVRTRPAGANCNPMAGCRTRVPAWTAENPSRQRVHGRLPRLLGCPRQLGCRVPLGPGTCSSRLSGRLPCRRWSLRTRRNLSPELPGPQRGKSDEPW